MVQDFTPVIPTRVHDETLRSAHTRPRFKHTREHATINRTFAAKTTKTLLTTAPGVGGAYPVWAAH